MQLGVIVSGIGAGGVIGFVLGFFAKKLLKIVAFVLLVYFLSLFALAQQGWLEVDWFKVGTSTGGSLAKFGWWLAKAMVIFLPASGAFILGLYLGIKRS